MLNSVSCMRCRYLLRGLDPAGVCPECGLPILETIDDLIRQARRLPRPRPVHPPLHELGRARLRVGAAGVALLALAFAGVWPWAEMRAVREWSGPWVDPDLVFIGIGVAFCVGAWLLSAVGRPHPDLRPWRDARLWMRCCAWGAPAAALLALWSEYVPWWQYRQFADAARWAAFLIIPATFAVFIHLSYLATGTRWAALPMGFTVAAVTAAVGAAALVLAWPPDDARDARDAPHRLMLHPVVWAFVAAVYVCPTLLLVTFVPVMWRAGRRRNT